MVRKTPKTELPPEHHFSLSHILTHTPTGTQDLQNVNDSINTTVAAYTNDIAEQLTSLANVEAELLQKLQKVNDVYDVVHNIRVDSIGNAQVFMDKSNSGVDVNKKKNKSYKLGSMFRMPSNKVTNNRLEQYTKIDNNFNELLNETVVQKKRINSLLERLKKVELNFSKRERLFDEKSPNRDHYSKLYNYGMDGETPKKVKSKLKESESTADTKVEPFQPETKPPVSSVKIVHTSTSNSSVKSEISQQKLNQYLTIENELEEIQKVKSNKSAVSSPEKPAFNPISLLMSKEAPTCEISDEPVTVRANDKTLTISRSKDPQVGLLLDGLKKLYT